jgi:muramoyltetrapeptide carboxypeptidase LdcA involved in peptidoglycan recycling
LGGITTALPAAVIGFSDLHALWSDPEVRMVLRSQGGSTATHLLDGINYDLLRDDPKILSGISDGTTLLNGVDTKSGLVTYNGPDLIWTFGLEMTPQIRDNILNTFFDSEVGELRPNSIWKHQQNPEAVCPGWRCLREGTATGRLVGGHIRAFANLLLAGYRPNLDDVVLFFEGTDNVARTDSIITALRLRGIFDRIAGVVLGWFDDSQLEEKEMSRFIGETFLKITSDYDFHILRICELGHNVENYIFPIGCTATVDATNTRIRIDEFVVG